jgi:hypothetical protein
MYPAAPDFGWPAVASRLENLFGHAPAMGSVVLAESVCAKPWSLANYGSGRGV